MTQIVDKNLYAVWLKNKKRMRGEESLDCRHVAADPLITEKQVCEYVKKIVIRHPDNFSIGDVPIEDIEFSAIKIVEIERGDIVGAEVMEILKR